MAVPLQQYALRYWRSGTAELTSPVSIPTLSAPDAWGTASARYVCTSTVTAVAPAGWGQKGVAAGAVGGPPAPRFPTAQRQMLHAHCSEVRASAIVSYHASMQLHDKLCACALCLLLLKCTTYEGPAYARPFRQHSIAHMHCALLRQALD